MFRESNGSPLTARRLGRIAGRLDDITIELIGLAAMEDTDVQINTIEKERLRRLIDVVRLAKTQADNFAKYRTAQEAKDK